MIGSCRLRLRLWTGFGKAEPPLRLSSHAPLKEGALGSYYPPATVKPWRFIYAVALGFTTKEGELRAANNVMPAAFKFVALGKPPRRLRDVLQLWPYQSALPVRLPEGQLTGASTESEPPNGTPVFSPSLHLAISHGFMMVMSLRSIGHGCKRKNGRN